MTLVVMELRRARGMRGGRLVGQGVLLPAWYLVCMLRPRFVLLIALASLDLVAVAACVTDEPASAGGAGNDGGGGTGDDGSTSGDDGSASSGDGGAGDDGSAVIDSGPPRFCQTATAPDGSADFFCADFDESDPNAGLSDAAVQNSDAATLLPTGTFYLSKPTSMEAVIPSSIGSYEVAQRGWVAAGAKTLRTVHVHAAINPAKRSVTALHADGLIDILTITLPIDSVVIALSYGTDTTTEDSGANPYEGYVVRYHRVNVYGFSKTIPVPPIPAETWTDVDLSLDLETGTISLAYGGSPVITPITFFQETTTGATGMFGGATYGDSLGGTYRFDNFTVTTTRAP